MGKKIFLDIGGHLGQTVEVVADPRWGYDEIVCFEPAPECWPAIERVLPAQGRLERFGLWDKDEKLLLNNPGEVGASISPDKDALHSTGVCEFVDASAWLLANTSEDDRIWAKINIEGAEAQVIDRLYETGALKRISHLLIHMDVRKIPSKRGLEDQIRGQLASSGIDYIEADDIQFGGVYRGTRNWLRWSHSDSPFRDFRYKKMQRLEHAVRVRLYPLKQRFSQ